MKEKIFDWVSAHGTYLHVEEKIPILLKAKILIVWMDLYFPDQQISFIVANKIMYDDPSLRDVIFQRKAE